MSGLMRKVTLMLDAVGSADSIVKLVLASVVGELGSADAVEDSPGVKTSELMSTEFKVPSTEVDEESMGIGAAVMLAIDECSSELRGLKPVDVPGAKKMDEVANGLSELWRTLEVGSAISELGEADESGKLIESVKGGLADDEGSMEMLVSVGLKKMEESKLVAGSVALVETSAGVSDVLKDEVREEILGLPGSAEGVPEVVLKTLVGIKD